MEEKDITFLEVAKKPFRAVMVGDRGAGKTWTALRMAVLLAKSGKRTLYVGSDHPWSVYARVKEICPDPKELRNFFVYLGKTHERVEQFLEGKTYGFILIDLSENPPSMATLSRITEKTRASILLTRTPRKTIRNKSETWGSTVISAWADTHFLVEIREKITARFKNREGVWKCRLS